MLELIQRLRGSREDESGSKATNTEGRATLGQRGKGQILLLLRKYQANGTEKQKFQSTGTKWAAYKTLHFCSFYSLLCLLFILQVSALKLPFWNKIYF